MPVPGFVRVVLLPGPAIRRMLDRHRQCGSSQVEREAVLFANEAFYRAFADRNIAAMEQVWAESEPVVCIHPGWNPIVGRAQVLASWRAILGNPGSPAIVCSRPRAFLCADSAFVICYEAVNEAVLVATNIFVREGRGWKLAHHHAGPVSPPADEEEEEAESAIH